MEVRPHGTVAAFLARAAALLRAHEAEHTLVYGGLAGEAPWRWLATVEAQERPVLAAVVAPPRSLALSFGPPAALPPLAGHLAHAAPALPGVVAPTRLAEGFAASWTERTGGTARVVFDLELQRLDAPGTAPGVPGALDQATAADLPLVREWAAAFAREAGTEAETAEIAALKLARGELFLWRQAPDARAMAAVEPGPPGALPRVQLVYTPPAQRGRGYARACVDGLGRRLLAGGARACLLFADIGNPAAARLYHAVGYRPVARFRALRFT